MPKEIIIGIHGLGGRGAWFNRLKERLEPLDIRFETLDLRGFGKNNSDEDIKNPYPKGHINNFIDWIEEVQDFYQKLKKENSSSRISILGHSLGGVIASNLIEIFPDDRLILSTPAFSSSRETFNLKFLLKAYFLLAKDFLSSSTSYIELPLSKKDYDPSDKDPLKVRFVTVKLLLEIQKMTNLAPKNLIKHKVPVLFLKMRHDQVVSNEEIENIFNKISSPNKSMATIVGDDHDWIWYDTVNQGAEIISKWLKNS